MISPKDLAANRAPALYSPKPVMRRGTWRSLITITTLLTTCVLGLPALNAACGEKKGAIMLAVTTDMKAPKDVNVVSVAIQVGPEIKYNFVGRVTPEGEVLLPATLAIAEPDDPTAPIKIRVIAFKDTKARVLRDVTTTVPRDGRVALLRMPLSFVNDGSAVGELPLANLPGLATKSWTSGSDGIIRVADLRLHPLDSFNPFGAEVVSACADPDQTMIDGECASSHVDSAALPDFDTSLVTRPDGKCFDCGDCFGGWREVQVDLASCTFAKGGDVTNVTLVTHDLGDCNLTTGNCFVPVDKEEGIESGWKDEGSSIRLPKGVCKKLREGARLGVVGGNACDAKSARFPVCLGQGAIPNLDAGADADASADFDVDANDTGPQLLAGADRASGIVAFPDRIYYSSRDGFFVVTKTQGQPQLLAGSPAPPTVGGWLVARSATDVVFANAVFGSNTPNEKLAYVYSGNTLNPISFTVATTQHLTSTALSATTAFYGFSDSSPYGEVWQSGLTGGNASGGSSPINNPKSLSYSSAQSGKLWAGTAGGDAFLCDAPPITNCPAPVLVDSVNSLPVEGIATTDDDTTKAFALTTDGIFSVAYAGSVGASTRLVTGDFTGITDQSGIYYARGLSATNKCAFYASPNGLEYITRDKSATGVLASFGGRRVLSVYAPIFAGQKDQHVYFTLFEQTASLGGAYRVKMPAVCL